MTHKEAVEFLEPAGITPGGTWADIGAGTGIFTLALMDIMGSGQVYAVDKNPHALWRLKPFGDVRLEIVEGDFDRPLPLPILDGVIMANTLHYSNQPLKTLANLVSHLRIDGTMILIEYETDFSNQWVPYPVRFQDFGEMCAALGLSEPERFNTRSSAYGHSHIYGAVSAKVSEEGLRA